MRSLLGIVSVLVIVVIAGCNSHPLVVAVRPDGAVASDGSATAEPDAFTMPDSADDVGREAGVPEVGSMVAEAGPDVTIVMGTEVGTGGDARDAGGDVGGNDDSTARDGRSIAEGPIASPDVNGPDARDGAVPDGAFCASQAGTGVILCDDFSSPDAGMNKVVLPWKDMTGMTVSLSGNSAVIQDPGAWSSSYVQWSTAVDFRDTSLEADMTAETASRSLSYVIWGSPPNYISAGLQRDEQAMYLWVVVNDKIQIQLSAGVGMAPNQTQRVKLEIRANGQIRCIVDDVVVITTTANLSALPTTLAPGIGANSYPSQRFTYDNFVVRKLSNP